MKRLFINNNISWNILYIWYIKYIFSIFDIFKINKLYIIYFINNNKKILNIIFIIINYDK